MGKDVYIKYYTFPFTYYMLHYSTDIPYSISGSMPVTVLQSNMYVYSISNVYFSFIQTIKRFNKRYI